MPKTYTEILKRIFSWKCVCIASRTRINGLPICPQSLKQTLTSIYDLVTFLLVLWIYAYDFCLPNSLSHIYNCVLCMLYNTCVKSLTSGFPCGSAGKESTCNAGDLCSIPGLGRSPGEGKGYPHQYSGLENSMDCMVHRVRKSQAQLRDFHFHFKSLQCYLTLWDAMDCVVQQDPVHGFARQEYFSGFSCHSPGDLPNLGTKPTSLRFLALAGVFFTTIATWETPPPGKTCHLGSPK